MRTYNEYKKIVIMTESIHGSGDVSAAKKLIATLVSRYNEIKIDWFVLCPESRNDIKNRITQSNLSKTNYFLLDNWQKITTEGLIKNPDIILIFPTAHNISSNVIKNLDCTHAPILQIHEYDHLEQKDKIKGKKVEVSIEYLDDILCQKQKIIEFKTGFQGLGLFIEAGSDKKAADDKKSKALIELINNEKKDKSIYFSYLNGEIQSVVNEVDFEQYIKIITRLTPNDQSIVIIANQDIEVIDTSELVQFFTAFGISRVQYYMINDLGKITPKERCFTNNVGKRSIILINPFPLPNETFQFCLQNSHLCVQVTGDQSLSEAISAGKFPVYQMMYWKKRTYSNFCQTVYSLLGVQHPYSQLLEFFKFNEDGCEPFLLDNFIKIWKSNEQQIQQGCNGIKDYLLEYKNLHTNIPKLIDVIYQLKEYYFKCINDFLKENANQLESLVCARFSMEEIVREMIEPPKNCNHFFNQDNPGQAQEADSYPAIN